MTKNCIQRNNGFVNEMVALRSPKPRTISPGRVLLKCPVSVSVWLRCSPAHSALNAASPLWRSPDLLRRQYAPIHKGCSFSQRVSIPVSRCLLITSPLFIFYTKYKRTVTCSLRARRTAHSSGLEGVCVWMLQSPHPTEQRPCCAACPPPDALKGRIPSKDVSFKNNN